MGNGLNPLVERVSEFTSLTECLRQRAHHQPKEIAYTFLAERDSKVTSWTYRELDRRARSIADRLRSAMASGSRALLIYPPGLEFIASFFGCLYAGIIAVPTALPSRHQNLSRLKAIVADCDASAVLGTERVLAELESRFAQSPALEKLPFIATDSIIAEQASDWQELEIQNKRLAFLQYTSGSTGLPKGVMVTHENLLHNSEFIKQAFALTPESRSVSWLPGFHDMGLIDGIIQPLYTGYPGVLMSPVSFLQQPIRWLEAIAAYGATHCGGPNFAYERCLQRIKLEQHEKLDLSNWESAYNGAEPVRKETLERFTEKFRPWGFQARCFYPCYGLAEATLMVTGGDVNKEPASCQVQSDELEQHRVVEASLAKDGQIIRSLVSCGRSRLNTEIVIANPDSWKRCESNQVGEIWVSGKSVAQGYWNQPDKTQETFQAYLNNTEEGPFLRTGDLGFIRDGELFVTGRIKDLIVIRGSNYYPQDIELTVERSHPALRLGCGAAFSVEADNQEQLVVVQEVERTHLRHLNANEVIDAIRRSISQEYGLSVYEVVLIKTATIPKTSSGKIQRQACRNQYLASELTIVGNQQAQAPPSVNDNHPDTSENLPETQKNTSQNRTNELIQWLRFYANQRINSRLIDERRCIPPYIVLDFGKKGLLGMQVPEQYGGLGLSYQDTVRVFEQLGAIDLTLASFVGVHHALGTRPLMNFAQAALQDQWLPLVAQGRELAAFAITEPGAGSNPKAIASTASLNPEGGWNLRGQKVWIGSGAWAGITNVFVQQLDQHQQPLGITGFAVPQDTIGLFQGPEALTMGMRGMVQNSILLKDVPVDSQQLLGEPGGGMDVAQDAMMFGRLGLGAISVGGMKRCAQLMLRYAQRRSIATGSLLNNPVTLIRLNELTAKFLLVETLIHKVASLLDQGLAIPEELYIACKTSGPEFLWQGTDHLMQLLGGRGYIETNLVPQLMRDARLLRIFEGPTETLTMFLGSRVVNKGETLGQFMAQTLGAPDIGQRLQSVAKEIYQRRIAGKFAIRSTAERWAYHLTGEIATLAILWGTAQEAYENSRKQELGRAIDWAKLCFEQKCQNILAGLPSEIFETDASTLTSLISQSGESIGDLEQTLAGEDHELDDLLSKNGAQAQFDLKPNINDPKLFHQAGAAKPLEGTAPRSKTPQLTQQIASLQNWMKDWLGMKLNLNPNALDLDKSFADYGMDSVMAVDFAFDLESWLDDIQNLEATIVWNFPNISSLARHLAEISVKTTDIQIETSASEILPQLEDSDSIEPPSPVEVTGSIEQEVAELEKLLRNN